jgi:hypothetical protein
VSITYLQASDLLAENYGAHWSFDDPEWWENMCEALMEYPSVHALRRSEGWAWLRVPAWWPGATVRP